MTTEALPEKISMLVDFLRDSDQADNISLTEVASITEVLIGTMRAYFNSIDTSIYRECRSMSEYINSARDEIANLRPADLENSRIPRAGLELDAIVKHTEDATNIIMTSGEEILTLLDGFPEDSRAEVETAVMNIFEACSFQDITGQRINKVVKTLAHIEERIKSLRDVFGFADSEFEEIGEQSDKALGEDLLSGPALQGEGIDQSEVDALLAEEDQNPSKSPAKTVAAASEAETKETAEKSEAKNVSEVPKENEATPEKGSTDASEIADESTEDKKTEDESKASKASNSGDDKCEGMQEGRVTSQEEIDALFG